MNYMQELRSLVGHRPILMVGAAVLVLDAQNRLLLHLRTDNHVWGIPGGSMEPGETVEETARREMKEETGLEAGSIRLFGVFSGPELFYEYPNGDQVYNVTVVYLCREAHGEATADGQESSELHYFPLEQLPPLSPPIIPIIAQLVREEGGKG